MQRNLTNASIAAVLICVPLPANAGISDPTITTGKQTAALATPNMCDRYAVHARFLASRYGEYPVFTGQPQPGVTMRIMANSATGSWTMLFIRADGVSCVRGVGQHGYRESGI